MKKNLLPSLLLTLCSILLFCGLYTAVVWGVAQFSPGHGEGQTITANGHTYYENIGQSFTQDRYFWSRPSAAGKGYDASSSAGSNKGPSNPDYLKTVQDRIDTLLVHNPGVSRAEIPSDLVTASGSGLDPHISVQAARVQVKRIAALRKLPEATLNALIDQHTEAPFLGLFGTERINVLKLNIGLDQLKP